MFSEILKIIPKLDSSDLAKMESALSSRFGKVAKKFGKGLMGALAGGGIAGLALGIVDKLLNPLKEIQEAMNKTLKESDDLSTNAKQFGTTSGKLFKLQQLGVANGVTPDAMFTMLNKFQNSVAEAKADPTKETSVRNFVGIPDTAEAFLNFIQSMSMLPKDKQLLVQQDVFGEKFILKMADFVNSAKDFGQQFREMRAQPAEMYTPSIEKLANLNDKKDLFEAARGLNDMIAKGRVINEGMINGMNASEQVKLSRENERIADFKNLMNVSMKMDTAVDLLEKGYRDLLDIAMNARSMSGFMSKLTSSRVVRGILGIVGDK